MRFPVLLLLSACLVLILAGTAHGRSAATPPWATVNVCDTTSSPNEIGIRAAMPGLARPSRLLMRFRVQYRDGEGRWRTVKRGADSGWVVVGKARRGVRDSGYSFEFAPPASGGAHVLRGVVRFEWRRGARLVQRERRLTEAGHPGTAGADPAGFSSAICEIA
jgi:hypothetical protein